MNTNLNLVSGQTVVILCVEERLNLAQVMNMQKHFFPLVHQTNKNIILDLRYVQFIDCSAIGCIISLSKVARTNNSTLSLCNLSYNVQLLADIMKLSEIIPISKTNKDINNRCHHNLENNKLRSVKYNPLFPKI